MARAARKPYDMHMCRVEVARIEDLGPGMRRITFAGQALSDLPHAGPDQRVKLLFSSDPAKLPETEGPYSVKKFMALWATASLRGLLMRTYTIRNHRPDAAEIDIDFALHGPTGPASRFAIDAKPGDALTIFGPASEYVAPAEGAWCLLAGDETALPAISAIVESLPRTTRGEVIIELADGADAYPIDAPAGMKVTWLDRLGGAANVSLQLRNGVASMTIPDGNRWIWLAGESSVTTSIRRHLVNDRGIAKADITFTGYWKYGKAIG